MGDRIGVLFVEVPRAEPGSHPHDECRPDLQVVRLTVYRAGLDGPGRGADGAGEPTAAGQPGTGRGQSGADGVAGAGSGRPVGRRRLLGLSSAARHAVPADWHGSFLKCQVLSCEPIGHSPGIDGLRQA